MRTFHAPIRRAKLEGWFKWLVVLLMPFTVFFFEAWLHAQALQYGFEKNSILTREAAVKEQLSTLKGDEAMLKRMARIAAKAPDLGLVEPNPSQIHIIRATPLPQMKMLTMDGNYDMARLGDNALVASAGGRSARATD